MEQRAGPHGTPLSAITVSLSNLVGIITQLQRSITSVTQRHMNTCFMLYNLTPGSSTPSTGQTVIDEM
jgi:hypothetical protein